MLWRQGAGRWAVTSIFDAGYLDGQDEEMAAVPTKAEVREAVERAIASRDELKKDPKALAEYINDDRVLKWNLAEAETLVRVSTIRTTHWLESV